MTAVNRDEAAKRKEKIRRRRARNKRFAAKAAFHGIRWDAYSHEALFEMIMSARPGEMGDCAAAWHQLGKGIQSTAADVFATVNKLLGTWHGAAAEQAGESNRLLTIWAENASDIALRVGQGLEQYTHAVHQAQLRMPPPVDGPGKLVVGAYHSGGVTSAMALVAAIGDQMNNAEQEAAARDEAVRVMKAYSNDSQYVHDTMPWFYDAPPGPTPTPITVDDSGTGSTGTGIPPGGTGTPPSGTDGSAGATTAESFVATPPGSLPGYGPGGGPGPTGAGPGYAGGLPGLFGVPGSGSDSSRGGSGFSSGGPGSASGGGGAASGSGPLAARGGPGAGVLGGGPRGAIGAGGPGGAGSLYPPVGGGGAPGEDDLEHKDKYNDGLDLFDDLPPAYPPVFGA